MPIRKFLHARGLGAYLAAAISALSLVLTLILVEVIGVGASDQVRSNIGNGLAELALQMSDKLDRGMFERYREVRLMAERADFVSAATPIEAKRRMLNALQETYPFYAWIGLAAPDGKVQVATTGMLEGISVSGRPWFKNALNGVYLGDVHEAVLLSKVLPKPSNEPKRFVDVAFPCKDEAGNVTAVLGAHLYWNWAQDIEKSIFAPVAARLKVESLIVSEDGVVVLGPAAVQGKRLELQSLRSAQKGTGHLVETWADGKTYLVGYSKSTGYASYPGLGWTVLVRQEADDAFARVKEIQRQVLWSGIALAALFSLIGFITARRVTRPLTVLAQTAQRIRSGEAVHLPRAHDSYYEVATLTESLDLLVTDLVRKKDALAELNATLELRVTERTNELGRALEVVRLNERRIQTIIDTAQDAYIATDLAGIVLDWNAAAERMFGWHKEEVIGKPLASLVLPERFRASYTRALGLTRESGSDMLPRRRIERIVMNRKGEEFPIEVTFALVKAETGDFFSAFVHDISERKKVEQLKNEFISTVSHELRTPLTSIRASLSMLADGMAGELPADTQHLISIANQSCERLVRLVSDVLDIEKIESGSMDVDIHEQPLAPLIEQAVASMAGYASEHGVRIGRSCEADLLARIDADGMMQVLTNLLSNAVKFSPKGAEVMLVARRTESGARISVSDKGEGIPDAFRDRIFQKFAQADATDSRRRGGTGLGLSICKSIVELHGGKLSFDSTPGAGTTFHVDLPT